MVFVGENISVFILFCVRDTFVFVDET